MGTTTYTEEEQTEHRRALVEALRSGKYSQTKNALHDNDGYCCLGVACDISKLGEWVPQTQDRFMIYKISERDAQAGVLTATTREYFGFPSIHGISLELEDRITDLVELNDDGFTFVKIADVIEWYYND